MKTPPSKNTTNYNLVKNIFLLVISITILTSSKSNPNFSYYLAIFLPIILYLLVHSISSNYYRKKTIPPGPLALPIFGNWLQVGNDLNHRKLAIFAKTYGNIFLLKLGIRNLVVVSNPELACEVLHAQSVEFGSRPRNVVFDIFTGNGQDMAFSSYGEHWRKMRRIMTLPFFTKKVVNNYSKMWEEEMDNVIIDLKHGEIISKKAKNEGIIIRKRLQLMLYNIMYKMMFNVGFKSMDDPMFIEATKFNSERSRLAQSFEYNYGDFIPLLRPFLRTYLNKCRDLQYKRLAFFNNYYIQKRRNIMAAKGKNEKISCAIDHIIDAEMKGEISEANVQYIVENINVAAIETTLWSMEWAIAELVNHPEIQHKIRVEINKVVDKNPITESSLEQLPYLQATIKETLRLHTPIPLLVPHMNIEEAKLGGYDIPKESKVVVNAWWLANNPEWWRKAEEFRPERFLEEEVMAEATVGGGKVDFRFLPFGVGRRSCPGIILALPILGLIVGKLVRSFEMKPPLALGVDNIDVSEKGGQFSLHIANHSIVVFKPVHRD